MHRHIQLCKSLSRKRPTSSTQEPADSFRLRYRTQCQSLGGQTVCAYLTLVGCTSLPPNSRFSILSQVTNSFSWTGDHTLEDSEISD